MSNRRSVYRSYQSHWRSIVAAGLFSMVGAMGETGALVAVASFAPALGDPEAGPVEVVFGPISIMASTGTLIAMAAALITFATMCRATSSYIGARAGASWTAGIRTRVIHSYLRAPFTFVAALRSARLHELTGQHARLAGQIISHLSGALNATLSLTVFMVSALLLDPTATVVFFLLGTVAIVAMRPALRWTRRQAKIIADYSVGLGVATTETTGVIREISTLGVRDAFEERIRLRIERLARHTRKVNFALAVTPQLFIGIGMLVLLGTFAAAAQFTDGTFATLGGTALLLFRALTFGQQVSGIQQRLNRSIPYTEDLNEFIAEATAENGSRQQGTEAVDRIDTLEFVDASFSYTNDDTYAVRDTSFKLTRPGLIAIVGPSGTGKTTVAHIALGLLRPTRGEVCVNGSRLADIRGADLPGLVALVPQEPVILHASVMDNIQFYRGGVSEERVIEVAKSIGIHDTIMELDDGYATEIGQTTRGLSGGQRQRIAIARALAGSPSLIILDEPTSALDGESEGWVMQTLTDLGERSLALVIAHRQETIDRCNGILRFDNGELVETVAST